MRDDDVQIDESVEADIEAAADAPVEDPPAEEKPKPARKKSVKAESVSLIGLKNRDIRISGEFVAVRQGVRVKIPEGLKIPEELIGKLIQAGLVARGSD